MKCPTCKKDLRQDSRTRQWVCPKGHGWTQTG